MSTISNVGDDTFEERAIKAKGLVVVDFSAKWCGPCKRLLPELEAAAKELDGVATFLAVDIDESPEVAMRYGVQGVPNLTFIRDGEVVDVQIGAIPKSAIVARARLHL